MEIANARLRLNKLGSDVPLKDVTPAEAVFLHILHGPYNGGLTFGEEFSKIEVVGTAKVATGKTKKVVVKEATEQKIVKGAMVKPAVLEQIVPGDVIKEAVPEKKTPGKPAVGVPGTPGYQPGTLDVITLAQPEQRAPGYKIAAQDAVYALDTIIPAEPAVVKEEPILVDRTDRQELLRLRAKYNGARTKENKPIIDEIWPNRLDPKFPQTFAEINWTEYAQATAGIETAPVNYVTDANYASTGGIAKTL